MPPEGWGCRCGRGTLYDVLQVSPWCEPEVIQAAFRALARSRHPDVNRDIDAENQMRRLNSAYQTLSDPVRRARYDEELALEAARVVTARQTSAAAAASSRQATTAASAGAAPNGRATAGAPNFTSSAPMYQTIGFDSRGESPLSRSAIYVSLVIVTLIVALIAWLVLDTLGERTSPPSRSPRGQDQFWPASKPASMQFIDGRQAAAEPGLSQAGERWYLEARSSTRGCAVARVPHWPREYGVTPGQDTLCMRGRRWSPRWRAGHRGARRARTFRMAVQGSERWRGSPSSWSRHSGM